MHYTTVWTAAPSRCETGELAWASNVTLRYSIFSALSGNAVRLRLSNRAGSAPIAVPRVSVARITDGLTIDPASVTAVTFGDTVAIAPGEEAVSDPAPFAVSAGESFAVSLYIGCPTDLTTSVAALGPLCDKLAAVGEWDAAALPPPEVRMPTMWYRLLTGVEVRGEGRTTVCFGDSITAQSWPDRLALGLAKLGVQGRAVVRRAVSGSRVLRQYDCAHYRHYGDRGTDRFEREVCVSGADSVIVLHGINDLIHPDGGPFRPMCDLPSAQALIDGFRQYIACAHAHGLRICLATVTPFGGWRSDSPEKQAIRAAVNAWIRTGGEADAVADFDAAVCDPDCPDRLAADCDSGDHLHPSDVGAQKMAACIPADFLR